MKFQLEGKAFLVGPYLISLDNLSKWLQKLKMKFSQPFQWDHISEVTNLVEADKDFDDVDVDDGDDDVDNA